MIRKLLIANRGEIAIRIARPAAEFVIEGVKTNLPFLRALIDHPSVSANTVSTRFIEENIITIA